MSKHRQQTEDEFHIPDHLLARFRTIATKEYTSEEAAELEARISGEGQDPAMYAKAQALSLEYNDFDIDSDGKVYVRR